MEITADNDYSDRSGSCAIVLLCVNEEFYVANVGDSRAIMSADSGKKMFLLSRDHRPDNENEVARIQANGGSIYQTQSVQQVPVAPNGNGSTSNNSNVPQQFEQQVVLGP